MYAQWKILQLTLNQVGQQATSPLSLAPGLKIITGTELGVPVAGMGQGFSRNALVSAQKFWGPLLSDSQGHPIAYQ